MEIICQNRRKKQGIRKVHCWNQSKYIGKRGSNLFGQHNNRCYYTIIKRSSATHGKCDQPLVLSETFQKFSSKDHKQEQQEKADNFSEMKFVSNFQWNLPKRSPTKIVPVNSPLESIKMSGRMNVPEQSDMPADEESSLMLSIHGHYVV